MKKVKQTVQSESRTFEVEETKGDGNCFFHAAFGDNINGRYVAKEAGKMRQEWFDFLNRFQSLKDEVMSKALKDQLKKIFNLFLDKPEDLSGVSDEIKEMASQTKEIISNANFEVQRLKYKIRTKFLKNEHFRKKIYEIVRNATDQPPSLQKLIDNKASLLREISNNFKKCVFAFIPDLSAKQYNERYDSEGIANSFLEDSAVYRSYLEAIRSNEHYVFFEEIPILASLAKITVKVLYEFDHGERSETFIPNQALVESCQSDSEIWGCRKSVVISHQDTHYSHVKYNEAATPLKRKATNRDGNGIAKRTKPTAQEDLVTACVDTHHSPVKYNEAATPLKKKATVRDGNDIAKITKPSTEEDLVTACVKKTNRNRNLASDDNILIKRDFFINESVMSGKGLKLTEHGSIFQLKLLMLCLWRATYSKENNQVKLKTFRLASDMPEAEKLDDVAFQYKEKASDKWKFRLIQAKHKEGENLQDPLPKIELKDLLSVSDKEDFSLQKYFCSYLKIKRRSHENSIYSVFSASETEMEDAIVLTNTDFHSEKEKVIFEDPKVIAGDILFTTEKQDTRVYKLEQRNERGKKIIEKLKLIFENKSDFYGLITSLADHLCNKKLVVGVKGIFKEYYYPLVREILSFNKLTARSESKPETEDIDGKFSVNLNKLTEKIGLNGEPLSAEAENIRDALVKEMTFRKGAIKISNIDKSFGACELPSSLTELNDLAKKLATFISDGREITPQDFKNDHVVLAMSAIDVKKKKFKETFIKEPENPRKKSQSTLSKLKVYLKEHLSIILDQRIDDRYLERITIKIVENFGARDLSTAEEDVLKGLAKKLVKVIEGGEKLTAEDFDEHHAGLTEEVIDVNARAFRKIFINGHNGDKELSPAVKKFRRFLLDEIKRNNQNASEEFNVDVLKDLLCSSNIRVSNGFQMKFRPEENIEIKNVVLFAKEMQMLLSKKQKVIEITDGEQTSEFYDNIKKLAGYVLIERFGKIRFSTAFSINNTFPGNLGIFKDKLRELIGNDKFAALYEYEFKFNKKFRTCEDGELFRKLPILHEDEDVKDFCKKLKFVVNYPNRFEISDLIGEEIKDELKKLDGRAFQSLYYKNLHKWMADRVGSFYTDTTAKMLFQEIQDSLSFWTIDGFNQSYFAHASKKCKFKIYSVIDKFLLGNKQVLCLSVGDLTLGRTRIVQTFQQLIKEESPNIQKYTRGFGHIFLFLTQLIDTDFSSEIIKVLNDVNKFNLIVIECDVQNINSELLMQLQTVIKSKKKVVFILRKTACSDEFVKQVGKGNNQLPAIHIDASSFDDIDMKDGPTKETLFDEKIVSLQGRQEKINLSELMGISKVDDNYLSCNQKNLKKIICAETLNQFLKCEIIKIGDELPISDGYDSVYYISRTFNQIVLLNEKKLQANIKHMLKSDFFVVCGSDSKLKGNKNVHTFGKNFHELAKSKYEELCRDLKSNIHSFKKDSEKLIWLESRGTVSSLVKFREIGRTNDTTDLQIRGEALIDLNGEKIVIIADVAGSGKSTVLTKLSLLMKKYNRDLWILRIDLRQYTASFRLNRESGKLGLFRQDISIVVDFLVEHLITPKLALDSEKELLKNCFDGQGRVALFFDGFDEICPHYEDMVTDLLRALKESKGVKKMFITTRPNKRELLEFKLGTFSYALTPFSEKDQINLLTKFWAKNLMLNAQNQKQRKRLATIAESKIKKFSFLIYDKKFTAVPLHTMMLAVVLQYNQNQQNKQQKSWQGREMFQYTIRCKTRKLIKTYTLCDFYNDFVSIKFHDVHLVGKLGRDLSKTEEDDYAAENFETFKERHEILAIRTLFSEDESNKLLPRSKIQEVEKCIEENECAKKNEGMIKEIMGKKPVFTHRTFAEFFAANFVGFRQCLQNEKAFQKLVLTSILIKSDYKVLRTFLYEYKKEGKLTKPLWDADLLNLLDVAYLYDNNDTDDALLSEKLVKNSDHEKLCFLFRILKQRGFTSTVFEIITDSCYTSALEGWDEKCLELLFENVDDKRLGLLLLTKTDTNGSLVGFIAEEFDFNFEELATRLSRHQIKQLFDDSEVWDRLSPENFGFIEMLETLLDENSIRKILYKHSEKVTKALCIRDHRGKADFDWHQLKKKYLHESGTSDSDMDTEDDEQSEDDEQERNDELSEDDEWDEDDTDWAPTEKWFKRIRWPRDIGAYYEYNCYRKYIDLYEPVSEDDEDDENDEHDEHDEDNENNEDDENY